MRLHLLFILALSFTVLCISAKKANTTPSYHQNWENQKVNYSGTTAAPSTKKTGNTGKFFDFAFKVILPVYRSTLAICQNIQLGLKNAIIWSTSQAGIANNIFGDDDKKDFPKTYLEEKYAELQQLIRDLPSNKMFTIENICSFQFIMISAFYLMVLFCIFVYSLFKRKKPLIIASDEYNYFNINHSTKTS
uniref:Uncharacterized protein n=1 Tax=Rhabditophanes sp. KR3021 TaxID=114890 RepID=A0AC35TU57_9BILA